MLSDCQKVNLCIFSASAARNEERGHAAVLQLNKMQLHPKFHQLDTNCLQSIRKLRDHLKENYGGLDVLVNNAGIMYRVSIVSSFISTSFSSFYNLLTQLWVLCKIVNPFYCLRSACTAVHIIFGLQGNRIVLRKGGNYTLPLEFFLVSLAVSTFQSLAFLILADQGNW